MHLRVLLLLSATVSTVLACAPGQFSITEVVCNSSSSRISSSHGTFSSYIGGSRCELFISNVTSPIAIYAPSVRLGETSSLSFTACPTSNACNIQHELKWSGMVSNPQRFPYAEKAGATSAIIKTEYKFLRVVFDSRADFDAFTILWSSSGGMLCQPCSFKGAFEPGNAYVGRMGC
jgi:hypothetical protein